jgi:hypothetical protein
LADRLRRYRKADFTTIYERSPLVPNWLRPQASCSGSSTRPDSPGQDNQEALQKTATLQMKPASLPILAVLALAPWFYCAVAGSEDINWDDRFGPIGVDNQINAIALIGKVLYVAGDFTHAGGGGATNIAMWDGLRWSGLGSGINSSVNTLATDGLVLYAGGGFTTAGGLNVNGIAKWNGANWSSLGVGKATGNATFWSVLCVDGIVYAGGQFTSINGVAATNIATFDGTRWLAMGSGLNGSVNALIMVGSDLYAGGSFSKAGGVSANNIAKWNGTRWSALGSGVSGGALPQISSVAVFGETVFAGGSFTSAGGVMVANVAQWDGSQWSPLGVMGLTGGSSTPVVSALQMIGYQLYAGGSFTNADGVSANVVAHWDGNAWSAVGLGTFGMESARAGRVLAMGASRNDLLVGGTFATGDTVNGTSDIQPNNLARWDGQQWTGVGNGVGGTGSSSWQIHALKASGNGVFLGGSLPSVAGLHATNIALWTGTNFSVLGSGVSDANGRGFVDAIETQGSQVYVGGDFIKAGDVAQSEVARWDGTDWFNVGSGLDNSVQALAFVGADLYAGGAFIKSGTKVLNHIARLDGTNWAAASTGLNGPVTVLRAGGTNLYAGGQFTQAGAVAALNLAKWDGKAWSPLGNGLGQTGAQFDAVQAIAVSTDGGTLYASGQFPSLGTTNNLIARWDGATWTTVGYADAYVDALALIGDNLYVGGGFAEINGVAATRIARWDGTDWSALGDGIPVGLTAVYALDSSGTDLFVGGVFDHAGGKADERFGIYHAGDTVTPSPELVLHLPSSSGKILTVSWSDFAAASGFGLQVSTNLGAGGGWKPFVGNISGNAGQQAAQIDASSGFGFFRLKKP